MGNCDSKERDPEAVRMNAEANRVMEEARRKQREHVKLLLLGAGESGKSTIAKQMKIIHLNGFSDAERIDYKSIIFSNVVGSIRVLVEAADRFNYEFVDKETGKRVMQEDYFNGEMTLQIARDIKTLLSEKAIINASARYSDFQLNDSADYYFQAIDRLAAEGYIPTTQDVLRSRAKTTGIIETEFTVEKTRFTLVDVGGQRSERRKWMHCFQDVTAVIFCVALSGYDLKLYEDENTNRMHEALKLFKDICNTKWFAETAIILFLNKKDIFMKKIATVPLKVCFPMYSGANTYEEAVKYIEDQFVLQNENPRKLIYTHKTCATDTENIMVVFKAVQDIALHRILEKLGM